MDFVIFSFWLLDENRLTYMNFLLAKTEDQCKVISFDAGEPDELSIEELEKAIKNMEKNINQK